MIVPEKDALARLESPLNLINRLRNGTSRRNSMGLFGMNGSKQDPSVTAKQDSLAIPSFVNPFDKQTALVPTISNSGEIEPPKESGQTSPDLDSLLDNADSKIKLSLAHDRALDTLVEAVDMIRTKMDDIKPDKLPGVIAAASKVVDQIQRQRIDANKAKTGREVHYHFYTPVQRKMEEYQVIDVG